MNIPVADTLDYSHAVPPLNGVLVVYPNQLAYARHLVPVVNHQVNLNVIGNAMAIGELCEHSSVEDGIDRLTLIDRPDCGFEYNRRTGEAFYIAYDRKKKAASIEKGILIEYEQNIMRLRMELRQAENPAQWLEKDRSRAYMATRATRLEEKHLASVYRLAVEYAQLRAVPFSTWKNTTPKGDRIPPFGCYIKAESWENEEWVIQKLQKHITESYQRELGWIPLMDFDYLVS